MALEVLSFYTKRKLKTQDAIHLVMTSTYFHVLIRQGKKIRELIAYIPKKYTYRDILKSKEFDKEKLKEYNVLLDFLKEAKERVMLKWHISEESFEDLLLGLKLCLIEHDCTAAPFKKLLLKYEQILRIKVHRLIRGIRLR